MPDPSRRRFLTSLTWVAVSGAAATVPLVAISAAAAAANSRSQNGKVTASVRNLASGEITVKAGGVEITCFDEVLAAQLTALVAAARA